MSLISVLVEYKWIILFYTAIFLLIRHYKDKFEIQGKIVALYRTKFGIKAIGKFADKYGKIIKVIGYIGIAVGYIGLIIISVIILDGFWKLFTTPDAPPTITPVIPGVRIPGSPIFVPFWYGIISLFIVVVIHEFSHGIVAAAHKLKIKNTGFGMFAIFPIAFVEPDEKEVAKRPHSVQNSIFAAGPFSNVIAAGIALALVMFILSPVQSSLSDELGVSLIDVQNNTPAKAAGLYPYMTIVNADSIDINNFREFGDYLSDVKANQTIILKSDKGESFTLVTTGHPKNASKGYLGVIGLHTKTKLKKQTLLYKYSDILLNVLITLFFWVFILSFGIGLANLLPLGPVDGGRMLQIACWKLTGNKKRGDMIWKKVSLLTLMIIIVLLFAPIIKAMLGI